MLAASSPLLGWYELAGIIVSLPVAFAIIWGVIRTVRHLSLVHEAIIGRPATAASDPIPSMIDRFHSVDEHLSKQDDKIEAIEGEFRTNGGSSVKDDLVKVQRQLTDLKAGQTRAATSLRAAKKTAEDAASLALRTADKLATVTHIESEDVKSVVVDTGTDIKKVVRAGSR